jgi:hypothetical protein
MLVHPTGDGDQQKPEWIQDSRLLDSPLLRALHDGWQSAQIQTVPIFRPYEDLKPLEAVLSGVKQPGDFFVCGAMEMPMPRVEVEGTGTLSFPVPDAQIAAIVRRAERAPYGKGEDTIVDTSVRNVWQIAPGKVKISF